MLLRFIGLNGYVTLLILFVMYAVMNGTYWQLMPTILYDVGEYDKYTTGNDRVGAIMSIQSVSEAIAEALGVQLLGIILQLAGFNGNAAFQNAFVLGWIENCIMVMPVILGVLSCVFIWKYPITREVFKKMKREIAEEEEHKQ